MGDMSQSNRVYEVVVKEGRAHKWQVHERLPDLNLKQIQDRLEELAGREVVKVVGRAKNPTTKRKVNVYAINPEHEANFHSAQNSAGNRSKPPRASSPVAEVAEQQELPISPEVGSVHPIIAGVEIPSDEYGRVSLNALHQASGAGESKEPNKWLITKQAAELREEIESQPKDSSVASVALSHGGSNPGTYAHPDLAISYAGWISPRFQLQVNRTFRQYQEGTLPARPEPAPQPALPRYETTRSLDQYLELAQLLGLGPDQAKWAAAGLLESETGLQVTALLHTPSNAPSQGGKDADTWLCPSDLGWLVGLCAEDINQRLMEAGLQHKTKKGRNGWEPTSEAAGFYIWDEFQRTNSKQTDRRLLWHPDVLVELGLKAA